MKYLFYFSFCKCFPNKISFSLLSCLLHLKELEIVTTSVLLVWSLLGLALGLDPEWLHGSPLVLIVPTPPVSRGCPRLAHGLTFEWQCWKMAFQMPDSIHIGPCLCLSTLDACRVSLWSFFPSGKHSK